MTLTIDGCPIYESKSCGGTYAPLIELSDSARHPDLIRTMQYGFPVRGISSHITCPYRNKYSLCQTPQGYADLIFGLAEMQLKKQGKDIDDIVNSIAMLSS